MRHIQKMTAGNGHNTPAMSQWSDISLEILRAELARRQNTNETPRPACGSKSKSSYNTVIHVFALFLILFLSIAACAFPIVARRFPKLPVPHRFLFISRHFGTGVLIATAFVHLFPTAYISLTDPCLPPFWNTSYPAMPGFIAMTSVFLVVGIEMFFASRGAGHVHGSEYDKFVLEEHGGSDHEPTADDDDDDAAMNGHPKSTSRRSEGFRRFNGAGILPEIVALADMGGSSENLIANRQTSPPAATAPLLNASNSPSATDEDPTSDLTSQADIDATSAAVAVDPEPYPSSQVTETLLPNSTRPLSPTAHQRALLQCLLLEAGILFHSVFIGIALSISTGPAFLVLLVAISFHQTFEGLALGSRIANLTFARGSVKPWVMAAAYGATTPLGQAIGLAVRGMYDPRSETGLLMVGIMNAVSSGLLLFAGLVELLAEDFLSVESYQVLYGRRRVEACAAVVSGSMLMALVGAWA